MASTEMQRKYAEKYRKNPNNKEKIEARKKVYIELRAGRLKKESCWACGSEKTQAHHEDYSRPLDIVWLCKEHHELGDRLVGGGYILVD